MARKKNTQTHKLLILIMLILVGFVGYLFMQSETFTRSSDASTGTSIFNPFGTDTKMTQRRDVVATNIVHWLPGDQAVVEPAGWNQDSVCWQPIQTVLQGSPIVSLAVEHMQDGSMSVSQVTWDQEKEGYVLVGETTETVVFERDLKALQNDSTLQARQLDYAVLQEIQEAGSGDARTTGSSTGSILLGWNSDKTCIISPITYNESLQGYTHSGPSTQIPVSTQFDTSELTPLIYTVDSQGGIIVLPAGWNSDQTCWQPIQQPSS